MKKLAFVTAACFIMSITGFAQRVEQIIEQRTVTLKGETKAMFGAKARSSVEIVLPENTVKWYYSFAANEESSMTPKLDLLGQVQKAIAANGVNGVDPTTFKKGEGDLSIDMYVLNKQDVKSFIDKDDAFGMSDISYEKEASQRNKRAAVIEVTEPLSGTWYLGLNNTNSIESAKITFEVVAIVDGAAVATASSSGASSKADMYGNLAWKKLEGGDYDAALEYCSKASDYAQLGTVKATRGLALLMKGEEDQAIETYIDAIVALKQQSDAKAALKEQLTRLDKVTSGKSVSGKEEVKDLLQMEYDSL